MASCVYMDPKKVHIASNWWSSQAISHMRRYSTLVHIGTFRARKAGAYTVGRCKRTGGLVDTLPPDVPGWHHQKCRSLELNSHPNPLVVVSMWWHRPGDGAGPLVEQWAQAETPA
ncbi:hypothetical protein CRG98_050153 [Punica granatum]|uniref:Uncharacterized protein n=1 Tax=Punica granatum TaxID=22663 RepID=A0A2I0GS18_PUNGR|nr:hypothetical protein CRG98_050153 [Punica granatum]